MKILAFGLALFSLYAEEIEEKKELNDSLIGDVLIKDSELSTHERFHAYATKGH